MITLTVGLPRSGKTTWAKKQGIPIVNPDSIRLALHGQAFYPQAEPFVWAIAYIMTAALLRAGNTHIIVDATNVTKKRREEWQDRFKNEIVTFKTFDTSPAECVKRAEETGTAYLIPVIEKMAAEWDFGEKPWLSSTDTARI